MKSSVDGVTLSIRLLLVASVLLLLASGGFWLKLVYYRDNRVFWGAVEQALTYQGVTKTQRSAGSEQRVELTFSPAIGALGYSKYTSPNGVTGSESVATMSQDFARYTTLQKTDKSTALDTSEIENIWVNTSVEGKKESKLLGDQLTNGLLIFVGTLPHTQRTEFVQKLRSSDVYNVIGDTRTETINRKKATVYRVQINIGAYNRALTEYLKLIGLPETASEVGFGEAETSPSFEIAIVPLTREILKVGYPDLSTQTAEEYTGWGVGRQLTPPTETISSTEFQQRIQKLRKL